MTVVANKAEDLQGDLGRWRSKRAQGVALVLVQRPEKQETHGVAPV